MLFVFCVGVSGAPTDNNIMLWNAIIFGPHETPFEDGTFKLSIEFTEEYPNKPPTVRFVSKVSLSLVWNCRCSLNLNSCPFFCCIAFSSKCLC